MKANEFDKKADNEEDIGEFLQEDTLLRNVSLLIPVYLLKEIEALEGNRADNIITLLEEALIQRHRNSE